MTITLYTSTAVLHVQCTGFMSVTVEALKKWMVFVPHCAHPLPSYGSPETVLKL